MTYSERAYFDGTIARIAPLGMNSCGWHASEYL